MYPSVRKNPWFSIFTIVMILLSAFACQQKETKPILKDSSGKINNLSIIIENQMWNGEVGDSLRAKFAAPVDGLPQQEPLFSISQYVPKLFEGFMTNSRNIIIVQKATQTNFEIRRNVYAQPQNVVLISGKNIVEIINLIETNAATIINTLKASEIIENQRRIKKSLLDDTRIKNKFNISLRIPTAYKYIIEDEKFFWIRKEIPSGNTSILIYELLYEALEENDDVVANIIAMRDSIGQKFIEGTLPNTYMVTEPSYAPYLFISELDGKKTFETKGTWMLKNDFMGGPFINYAIRDDIHQRYLVIEGFCYNPSQAKRDLMQELEAIIKSVKFIN
jgi:hypothetical protein